MSYLYDDFPSLKWLRLQKISFLGLNNAAEKLVFWAGIDVPIPPCHNYHVIYNIKQEGETYRLRGASDAVCRKIAFVNEN